MHPAYWFIWILFFENKNGIRSPNFSKFTKEEKGRFIWLTAWWSDTHKSTFIVAIEEKEKFQVCSKIWNRMVHFENNDDSCVCVWHWVGLHVAYMWCFRMCWHVLSDSYDIDRSIELIDRSIYRSGFLCVLHWVGLHFAYMWCFKCVDMCFQIHMI